MHIANFMNSAGWIVVKPRFSQPLLPSTSIPKGVKVSACNRQAPTTKSTPVRFQNVTGIINATKPSTKPIRQNAPWFRS